MRVGRGGRARVGTRCVVVDHKFAKFGVWPIRANLRRYDRFWSFVRREEAVLRRRIVFGSIVSSECQQAMRRCRRTIVGMIIAELT